jgi:hypothetical protein
MLTVIFYLWNHVTAGTAARHKKSRTFQRLRLNQPGQSVRFDDDGTGNVRATVYEWIRST